jgi:prephenate dehydratase
LKKVAFQGERGAFSEAAATSHFGAAETIGCREFADVVDAVVRGRADYAVLPIENSLAGAVPGVADLLRDTRLEVTAELWLPIHHCLLGVAGSRLAAVECVLSHPVALAQCTRFFARHPGISAVAWYDTAGAAKHIARSGDVTVAAIASEAAARSYSLDILESNLEDRLDNRTRFVIVGARSHSSL